MLVLTQYIAKHEFKPLNRFFTIHDLTDGARKILKGLAIEIRSPRSLQGFRFFKVRIGKRGSGRMIVFLLTASQKIAPIMIRLKKDKIFGMNMAMNNSQVVQQINKNLDRILDDIAQKRYQEFSL